MIDIETCCEVCGTDCSANTEIEYEQRAVKLHIECPGCTSQIAELTTRIQELEDELDSISR